MDGRKQEEEKKMVKQCGVSEDAQQTLPMQFPDEEPSAKESEPLFDEQEDPVLTKDYANFCDSDRDE